MNADGPGPIFTPFHARRIAAAGETVEQDNASAAQAAGLKRPGRAEGSALSARLRTRRLPHPRRIRLPAGGDNDRRCIECPCSLYQFVAIWGR